MKRTITHLLLLLFLSVSSSVMAADDVVTVNGVKYQGLTDDSGKNVVAAKVVGADPLKDGILTIAENVTIGGKKLPVTAIGESAFECRADIKQINFPSSLRKIDRFAFMNCVNLLEVILPESVYSLEYAVFFGCSRLENVILSDNIEIIPGKCFGGCICLKSIKLPKNLGDIDDAAFMCCESLTELTLPEKLWRISGYAFTGCSRLTKVILPASLSFVGLNIFANCNQLTSLTFLGQQPPQYAPGMAVEYEYEINDIIKSSNSTLTIIVPEKSENNYKNDPYWGQIYQITNGITHAVGSSDNVKIKDIFDMQGRKLSNTKAGINIIVNSNGNIKKVAK